MSKICQKLKNDAEYIIKKYKELLSEVKLAQNDKNERHFLYFRSKLEFNEALVDKLFKNYSLKSLYKATLSGGQIKAGLAPGRGFEIVTNEIIDAKKKIRYVNILNRLGTNFEKLINIVEIEVNSKNATPVRQIDPFAYILYLNSDNEVEINYMNDNGQKTALKKKIEKRVGVLVKQLKKAIRI